MADDTSTDETPVLGQIEEEISETRADLLAVLGRAADAGDGGLPTGALRREAGVPSGSIGYHMDALEAWGLVDVVGREQEGGGDPSKVWALTDRGREFLDRPAAHRLPTREEVRALHDRVDALEDELAELKTAYNQMADIVEDLAEES
ncbi:helix-turn-helix domain-containing protein [Halorubrum tropicale]|uniref:helix-turn-helix domain-containing protein n=1 Tax=Halorubrum tropicale TaxID=1765655 RepID=UPI00097F81E7|nr:helix-turn-helix domain-containing protein [Halorubrum tropicale]